MAKIYKVEMILILDDESQHPRKWVADAINECLDLGEDIFAIHFDEVESILDVE